MFFTPQKRALNTLNNRDLVQRLVDEYTRNSMDTHHEFLALNLPINEKICLAKAVTHGIERHIRKSGIPRTNFPIFTGFLVPYTQQLETLQEPTQNTAVNHFSARRALFTLS